MIAVILIQGYYGNITVVLKVCEKLLIFCGTARYKKQMDHFLRQRIPGLLDGKVIWQVAEGHIYQENRRFLADWTLLMLLMWLFSNQVVTNF